MSEKENLKTLKTSSLILNKVNYLENKKDGLRNKKCRLS